MGKAANNDAYMLYTAWHSYLDLEADSAQGLLCFDRRHFTVPVRGSRS